MLITGIEPVTSALLARRSTDLAKRAGHESYFATATRLRPKDLFLFEAAASNKIGVEVI